MGFEMPKKWWRQAFCVENGHGNCATKIVFHSCTLVSEQGKTSPNTKIPSWQHIRSHHPQALGDDGDGIHSSKKYHFQSLCVFLKKAEKRRIGRTILQYIERNGGKLQLRKPKRGNNQRNLHQTCWKTTFNVNFCVTQLTQREHSV